MIRGTVLGKPYRLPVYSVHFFKFTLPAHYPPPCPITVLLLSTLPNPLDGGGTMNPAT